MSGASTGWTQPDNSAMRACFLPCAANTPGRLAGPCGGGVAGAWRTMAFSLCGNSAVKGRAIPARNSEKRNRPRSVSTFTRAARSIRSGQDRAFFCSI